jgi:hypothetical protein
MSNENKDNFDVESNGFGVPEAPAPRQKEPENLPDWAKITSSIVEETEDAGQLFDEKPKREDYVPPKKGFGVPMEDLSDDELFLEEGEQSKSRKIDESPNPEPVRREEEYTKPSTPPIEESRRVPSSAAPVSTSRTVPDYEEEEYEEYSEPEEEYEEEVNKKSLFKKVPKAKQKQPRSVKSAKSVKKAISSGVMGKESDIMAPRGRMAGNRWKLIGLRTAVWGTLGLIMFSGVVTIFGPKGPSITALTQQVLLNLNRNNFPLESGQHLASRFAKEYLNLNPAASKDRSDILKMYIAGNSSSEASITSFVADRTLRVIGEPILAQPAELISDSHVIFTFAVQVFQPAVAETEDAPGQPATPPEWVYLAVPVSAAEDGSVAIAGMPAIVPQPKIAATAPNLLLVNDREARSEALPQIERFLGHWAASDEVALKPYLIEGLSTSGASVGLGSTVEFVALNKLTVQAFPADYVQDPEVTPTCAPPNYGFPCRQAYVEATWRYGTFEIANNYRMIILFDGQNWRVIDIRGAHFGPIGG